MLRLPVADPEGRGPVPSATPVKTSQKKKKDGRHGAPQVLRVMGPYSDKFLNPLLDLGRTSLIATFSNLDFSVVPRYPE